MVSNLLTQLANGSEVDEAGVKMKGSERERKTKAQQYSIGAMIICCTEELHNICNHHLDVELY